MPDIRLVPVASPDIVTLDWLQTPTGQLDETAELASAVTIALCSDAVALPTDTLPTPTSDDRRGWWGDLNADTIWGGWPLGSKLWLLTRAKIVDAGAREGATVERVRGYIQAALQPFIAHRLCSRVSVDVAQVSPKRIDASVVIYRGPRSAIELQYQALWDELFGSLALKPMPPTYEPPRLNYSDRKDSQYLPGLAG